MRSLKPQIKLTDEVKISKYVTITDKSDQRIFNNLLNTHERLQKTHDTGKKIYPLFEELHQDIFNIFFKYKPLFNSSENIDYNYFLNETIIKTIVELDKYKEARNLTKLDHLASAVGMEYIGEDVFRLIEDLKEEHKDLIENIQKANEGLLDLENKADNENLSDEELDILHIKYNDAVKLLEEYKKTLLDKVTKEKKSFLNRMVEKAVRGINEVDNLISAWGIGRSTSFTSTGYQEKIKLLNRLRSTKLTQIANLLGRYRQMALQSQREKVKKGFNEIFDVITGNDLQHILPSELTKLSIPELNDQFLKDFSEHKLLQYKYESKEKKQKGPIIACIDNSGSMSGQPEIWSKTVALGLVEIAKLQKRSCFIIHFDSGRKEDCVTFEFLRKQPFDLNKALDMCEYFSSGGTDFEPPLELAKDKIELDGNYEKADIIFITDGEAPIRPDWLQNFLIWKRNKKVNIYSVLIDVSYNTSTSLKMFSNDIFKLQNLRNAANCDSVALSIFSAV